MNYWRHIVFWVLFFQVGYVSALDMGAIRVRSALNQPLRADIPLSLNGSEIYSTFRARLAPTYAFQHAGISRGRAVRNLRFSIQGSGRSRYVSVTSARPVRDPMLDFLVEVYGSQGRLVREFTVMLDPPVYRRQAVKSRRPVAVKKSKKRVVRSRRASKARSKPRLPKVTIPKYTLSNRRQRISRGQTLWNIARRSRSPSVSVNQMMAALVKANPHAFAGGDPSRMLAGAVLRIPTFGDEPGQPSLSENAKPAGKPKERVVANKPTAPTSVAKKQEPPRGKKTGKSSSDQTVDNQSKKPQATVAKKSVGKVRLLPADADEAPSKKTVSTPVSAGNDSFLIPVSGNQPRLQMAGLDEIRQQITSMPEAVIRQNDGEDKTTKSTEGDVQSSTLMSTREQVSEASQRSSSQSEILAGNKSTVSDSNDGNTSQPFPGLSSQQVSGWWKPWYWLILPGFLLIGGALWLLRRYSRRVAEQEEASLKLAAMPVSETSPKAPVNGREADDTLPPDVEVANDRKVLNNPTVEQETDTEEKETQVAFLPVPDSEEDLRFTLGQQQVGHLTRPDETDPDENKPEPPSNPTLMDTEDSKTTSHSVEKTQAADENDDQGGEGMPSGRQDDGRKDNRQTSPGMADDVLDDLKHFKFDFHQVNEEEEEFSDDLTPIPFPEIEFDGKPLPAGKERAQPPTMNLMEFKTDVRGKEVQDDSVSEQGEISESMPSLDFRRAEESDADAGDATTGESDIEILEKGIEELQVEDHSMPIADGGKAESDDDTDYVQIKMDVAMAFMSMGDSEGARGLLNEVVKEGNEEQRRAAEKHLAEIKD